MQNVCPICGQLGMAYVTHACYGQARRNPQDDYPNLQRQQYQEGDREYALRMAVSRIESELAEVKAMLRKVLESTNHKS